MFQFVPKEGKDEEKLANCWWWQFMHPNFGQIRTVGNHISSFNLVNNTNKVS